ncbi:MAG TPA: hypothetical protein ACFCUY_12670 [Xenococcaceae cyanobacterium]
MDNLEQQICDRVLKSCGEAAGELFKFCQLQMVLVEGNSALLIQCPNSWTAEQLMGYLIGKLGQTLHSMGIDRAVVDDGEGMKSYYQWNMTNFVFKGYFVDGDLDKLAIVPIPDDEDIMDSI